MVSPRERRVERRHGEYSRFWNASPWTSEVERTDGVTWVYELAIAHRRRQRVKFVVYVGCSSSIEAIETKRKALTPDDCVSFVRVVEIRADDRASGIRKAAVFVGMCKSDFDYACVDGKRALVVPTFFGSRLQRIGYGYDFIGRSRGIIASSDGGISGTG